MSLSDRLRAAEQQRRSSTTSADDSTLDLTSSDAAVIDLTARRQQSSGSRAGHGSESTLEPYRFEPGPDEPMWAAGAEGISYNPVRDGDATRAFDDPTTLMADRMSSMLCPRCGGATQIDLFDQVHQTTSLSCLACFHMFRVEA